MNARSAVTKVQAAIILVILIIGIVAGATVLMNQPGAPTPSQTLTTIATSTAMETLIVGTTQTIDNLDSAITGKVLDYEVGALVAEKLLAADKNTPALVVPWLAQSYKWTADLTALDITLRPGIAFQDGSPLDAAAVKYSFDRAWKMQGPLSYDLLKIDWKAGDKAIEVLDSSTVRFHVAYPSVTFLQDLAAGVAPPIVPKGAVDAAGDNWGLSQFTGSGPFKLVEFVKSDRIVLERWDGYWGQKPQLQKIIIKMLPDATTARLALETGEVDIFFANPSPYDIPAMMANPNLVTQTVSGGWMRYLFLNERRPEFANKLVRQAIFYALDRNAIVNTGWRGIGDVPQGLMETWMAPYFMKSFDQVYGGRDVSKAKQLLTKAGYPNGFEFELAYTPTYQPVDVPVLIASELGEIGIKVTLKSVEFAKWISALGEYEAGIYSWIPDYVDPNNIIDQMITYPNGYYWPVCRYNNTAFLQLSAKMDTTFDQTERIQLYQQEELMLVEDLPYIPLIYEYRYCFANKWVKGLVLHGLTALDWIMMADCYIER